MPVDTFGRRGAPADTEDAGPHPIPGRTHPVSTARISIHTDHGGVDIRRTPPALDVSRTPPGVRITRREAQVSYDRTDYESAINSRRISAQGEHLHEEAMARTLEAIAQISAEGDTLARIEDPGNSIASVAMGKLPDDEGELTLSPVPPPVRRTVDQGGVSIEGVLGTLRISARLTPVEVHVRRAVVSVDMEVPPTVNLTA